VISAKVEVGLSAQRIYQDLVEQNGLSDSYQSVQRFVGKLKETQPQRVWRMEARPGEEVQVDFGLGAAIGDYLEAENGSNEVKSVRAIQLDSRATLSHNRLSIFPSSPRSTFNYPLRVSEHHSLQLSSSAFCSVQSPAV
jgi:hypothetical protein